MNTLKTIFTLSLCILVLACGSKGKQNELEMTQHIDEFSTFKIPINPKKVKLKDAIESVRIVRLEETDESLLGIVLSIEYVNGQYVFPDSKRESMYWFSADGKFLKKLNRLGDGPEEYADIQSFWIENDELTIFSSNAKKLITYNAEGEFVRSQSIPYQSFSMNKLGDNYFLDVSDAPVRDSLNYYTLMLDADFKEVSYEIPYDLSKDPPFTVITNYNLRPYQNTLLFTYVKSDTIYKLNQNGIVPFMHLDFEGGFFWDDESVRKQPYEASSQLNDNQSEKVWIFSPYVGEKMVFTRYNMSFRSFAYALLNMESGGVLGIDTKRNEEDYFLFIPQDWYGEELLTVQRSSELAEMIEGMNPDKVTFEEGSSLDVIESSENPVLVWITFKDF